MSIPLHETDEHWVVAYTGRWDADAATPEVGERWLTTEEARARYDAGEPFDVVEASAVKEGLPLLPRWTLAVLGPSSFWLDLHTPVGTHVASVRWEDGDGEGERLFVVARHDFWYPRQRRGLFSRAPEQRRGPDDRVRVTSATYDPSGTGLLEKHDLVRRESFRTRFADADLSTLWSRRPEFGAWDTLVDPDAGVLPPDFAATPL